MITYQVTIELEREYEADWLAWMTGKHIPGVMDTGLFTAYRLAQRLQPECEAGRVAYIIEYDCPDRQSFETYQANYAPALQAEHNERYGGNFSAGRKILQETPASEKAKKSA